jgi:hypothetical protein
LSEKCPFALLEKGKAERVGWGRLTIGQARVMGKYFAAAMVTNHFIPATITAEMR